MPPTLDTKEANRRVHAHLASTYNSHEPHFRPENQQKVKGRLEQLRRDVPGGKLLDIGCGTGFIIHLAADVFDEIHGVDITPEMMAQVDKSRGNITLHEASAEKLPFDDASFDAITAYSFLDHLEDVSAMFREAARVLRPGGRAYIDLCPNRLFWQALRDIAPRDSNDLSDIVARERHMVLENAAEVEAQYGLGAEIFKRAEPGKLRGGIDHVEIEAKAKDAGFRQCETLFDWFLGQGAVMHGQSFADATIVESYLRRAAPLTRHLFKYLCFFMTK
jgi:ubiquinone/menaquinone biosynthesis C-methylase UbiE